MENDLLNDPTPSIGNPQILSWAPSPIVEIVWLNMDHRCFNREYTGNPLFKGKLSTNRQEYKLCYKRIYHHISFNKVKIWCPSSGHWSSSKWLGEHLLAFLHQNPFYGTPAALRRPATSTGEHWPIQTSNLQRDYSVAEFGIFRANINQLLSVLEVIHKTESRALNNEGSEHHLPLSQVPQSNSLAKSLTIPFTSEIPKF